MARKMEGYTGCVALFDSGKPGKTIALRFDIDCVNVTETHSPEHIPNKEGFASINDGFMHACGHDSHITIGLGVALWIAQNKDKLTGKVKLYSNQQKKVFVVQQPLHKVA